MLQAVFLGGVFIGVLSALPIVNIANCCCLWVIGGGVLAAYLQQQNEAVRSLPVGRGAVTGLLAGVVGAFVWLVLSVALSVVIGPLQQQMLQEVLRRATDMPPDVRSMLEGLGDRASSPLQYILGFLFHLFLGSIFATAGGAVGAAFFKRDVPPAMGGDPIAPPLPPQP